MFATQQYLDVIDSGRKRLRDDEDMVNMSIGFGEHRDKRLQSLPLRNSPRASQQSLLPQSIVPLNASPAEAGSRHTVADPWTSKSPDSPPFQQDAETDMMDTTYSAPSIHEQQQQQQQQQPGFLAAQHDCSTSRMPTPIQPSFASQVRGQNTGWVHGQATAALNGVINLGHHVTGFSQDECVPRAMNVEDKWHVLQGNRRLPSPICEIGDSDVRSHDCTPNGMMTGNEDCLDAQSKFPTQIQSSASCHSAPIHAMEHPNFIMTDNDIHLTLTQHPDLDTDSSLPSPVRRGHQRSKHTVNSWTWQPGMKKSFSIGYRSDCEKCRLKVPGHFNHIVIS